MITSPRQRSVKLRSVFGLALHPGCASEAGRVGREKVEREGSREGRRKEKW